MKLPVTPPVSPMLAKLTRDLPREKGLYYEPKWDGFRCIVFRDGDEIELGSRNEKPLTRYFPELVESLRHELPERCVLDGEIVVAGFRTHKDGAGVGSLLLGLYDASGTLHHVGVASGFSVARRKELVDEVAPYRKKALEGHPWAGWAEAQASGRAPGAMNRWNAGKDMTWEPLRPEAVCEVSYDHLQENRFRHATSLVRWRPDRDPGSCTYDQLDTPIPMELSDVFGTTR